VIFFSHLFIDKKTTKKHAKEVNQTIQAPSHQLSDN
jgi:hypothetical protein